MTKNNPGPFDCYVKAEPDEPMFVLLGRDPNAATLVWLWAVLREIKACDLAGAEAEKEAAKVKEARDCVVAMIAWLFSKGTPVQGVAESALAAVFELMRAANFGAKCVGELKNNPTNLDVVRAFLSASKFEGHAAAEPAEPAEPGERIAAKVKLVNGQVVERRAEITRLEEELRDLQRQCPHDVTRASRCEGETSSEICLRCGHVN